MVTSGWMLLKMIVKRGLKFRFNVRSISIAFVAVAEFFRVLYYAISPHHAFGDSFGKADGFMQGMPVLLWICALDVLYLLYLAAISRATNAGKGAYRNTRIALFVIIGFVILLVMP